MINTHPVAGYDIVKGVDFPWPATKIVRQRHGRLDGSGYPDGLKGEEIRRGRGRIYCADAVDACVRLLREGRFDLAHSVPATVEVS